MVYVALMRGINVGGKNKVDMKQLKEGMTQIGMQSVVTYINSGNVIFNDHAHTKSELASLIEGVIQKHFQLNINVLILSLEDFQRVISFLPDSWQNDETMKADVLFLWDAIVEGELLSQLPNRADIDHIIIAPGAILWSVDRKLAAKSGMSKLVGTRLYKRMTIRNVNTTRKIYELMQNQVQHII